jgi:hypothetical protein
MGGSIRYRPESLKRYVSNRVKWLINGKQRTTLPSLNDGFIDRRSLMALHYHKLLYEFTITCYMGYKGVSLLLSERRWTQAESIKAFQFSVLLNIKKK